MKFLVPKFLFFLGACLVSGLSYAEHLGGSLLFSARLSGDNQVPAITVDGEGVATFTLNESMDSLSVNISAAGLTGGITGVHLHEGAVSENGVVVYNMTDWILGNRVVGVITGGDLTSEMIQKLLLGNYYVNVHTEENPSGELRGQVGLESDWHFSADISVDQTVPEAQGTTAWGVGSFNLSQNKEKLQIRIVIEDLSSPIVGVALYYGAPGAVGVLGEDLGSIIQGNTIVGEITPSAATIENLLAGNVYVNIHTDFNISGETRGHLELNQGLAFDTWLNGEQAGTAATGVGVGNAVLNSTLDSIWYDVALTSLTSAITAAHFHKAAAGSNGGVILNLSSDISGNRIKGVTAIDAATIKDFLTGEMYLNIHTGTNTGGEIRGQVYRLAREGYVFSLDGAQQTPGIIVNGEGSGMVSIDRDQTNAHFMMTVSQLTGAITSAHFHAAPKGESGGVTFDLSSYLGMDGTEDGAFGYWTSTDATTPFVTQNSVQFRSDSVYVNIHTDANAAGEVRGQVWRGFNVITLPTVDNGALPMDPNFSGHMLYSVKLTGAQAGTTEAGLGAGGFLLNPTMDTIWVNITVDSLTGPITGIHIHEGAVGVSGGVITDLGPLLMGNQVSGFITGFDISKFISGEYYVNVHTEDNAAGEIRGQILPETDVHYSAWASGADFEVPVVTDAYGLGTFDLAMNGSDLEIRFVAQDLSGPITAAHLHLGAAGAAGGAVVADLGAMIDGNAIVGNVDPTTFIADLIAGNVYINIHTTAHVDGEIRGQLSAAQGLAFDGWLNGAQSVPASKSSAYGVVNVWLNTSWDTLSYNVVMNGLSGAAASAHFHNAAQGQNGGVLANLTDAIEGNQITGEVTGTELTDELIMALVSGDAYVNIHTNNFPSGEIRGQIYRLARDGYSYQVCAEQHDPEATDEGKGSGIVSIDRWSNNAHYMVTTTGLTGAITSAHFHEGAQGSSGGVLFNLSANFATNGNSAFGYLTDSDGFDELSSSSIKAGDVYLNVHTVANGGGEIRGQVVRSLICSGLITSTFDLNESGASFEVYPNPANDQLSIATDAGSIELIIIRDMLGNTLKRLEGSTIYNVSNLNEGVYMLEVTTERGIGHTTFVKQ